MQPILSSTSLPPAHARSRRDIAFSVSIVVWWLVTLAGLAAMPWIADFFVTLFARGWPALVIVTVLWGTVPILATILTIRRFRTGDPGGALRLLPLPLVAIVLWFFGADIAILWRFHVERPAMMETINARRPSGGEAFITYFKWHGIADQERGVLFDESDEIGKPVAQRSAKWKQTAVRCFTTGKPLGGHFYFVRSSLRC
jgi:hypothetical protein